MRIPCEWLNEFVVLDIDPHDLAMRLTMRGFEVEAIEEYRPTFDGVCVGQIMAIDAHPNAGNLTVCSVNVGLETLPIVCGAKNIRIGDKVPLALVGARLAGNFLIEKRAIRGVESPGMLCSEKELGLSDDHSGIFIVPEDVAVGSKLAEMKGLNDSVLDISVPPNRGDCLSVLGIAREVGSILNQRAKLPMFKLDTTGSEDVEDRISLAITDTDACPRYVLRMIKGISIGPAPFWMRNRIQKCGMRPINAIVDVTNYVMLELGQPLHAFDYHALADKRIEVRVAEGDTAFRTLDGEDRKLVAGDIMICDGSGPVAIAGIMGGENSEITASTKDIALESAFFNPLSIRETARRLGIRSEASLRFEKGVDRDSVDFAAERAIFLMNSTAGGTVLKGKREIHEKGSGRSIFVSFAKIIDILGVPIEHSGIISALRSVDLHILREEENGFVVSVPGFRHDLEEYMDIIEEVARIYGYDHVPATTPAGAQQVQKRNRKEVYLKGMKEYLTSCGFFELVNFAFFNIKDIESFRILPSDPRSSCVPIMNPIGKDYEVMRTFVAANVLKSIAYNLNRGAKNLKFFEMGKIFFLDGSSLPVEYPSVCFAMTGREREYFWRDPSPEYDFFDIKGVVEGLADRFGLQISVSRSTEEFLNRNRAADILAGETKIGWMGEIRGEVLRSYGIEQTVYCAELRSDLIVQHGSVDAKYRPIPRFPQVTRDFAFYMDENTPVGAIIDRIRGVSPLITGVGVFDMFKKETKSIALRVVFQSFEETLTDETVNALQEIIIREATSIQGVMLRT
ncbi:MAG: Phenylalanine--tRNA ligase beta subunit [Syntrophorhabdus sp. PtaU1.Bin002]|nr:MAG: Phenylalanine--tRNA ligase beta subunit [Syntrophorhabdus sp. PtaB.Bin006]OPY72540.1 MAG: Phenylalanine--tRNA ligase beta subunit [Syntrophorhabdus sp. PtaU1.Bin002]